VGCYVDTTYEKRRAVFRPADRMLFFSKKDLGHGIDGFVEALL
jgi:hypothetical protein